MALKLLILFALVHCAVSKTKHKYTCSKNSAILLVQNSAYNFSINLLDRVAQDEGAHFVVSPLTTWLQLNALAEGATGETFNEIKNVTRHNNNRCFKLKLAGVLENINRGLKYEYIRKSVMIIDKFSGVRKKFVHDVKKFYDIKVMLENFKRPDPVVEKVNKYIETGTNYVISDAVSEADFINTVMVLSDNLYFRTAWNNSFNPVYTRPERFLAFDGTDLGQVNMMSQIGYFNYAELPEINAKVIELPCLGDVSMLLFLPTEAGWLGEVFYNLHRVTFNSIFIKFKSQGLKLVNVSIPRFKTTTVHENLPELIDDIGVRRVFKVRKSELNKISNNTMYASWMRQITDIEVNEEGVRATASVETLVNDTNSEYFTANKPFVFILVDKITQFILFAGAYSQPTAI